MNMKLLSDINILIGAAKRIDPEELKKAKEEAFDNFAKLQKQNLYSPSVDLNKQKAWFDRFNVIQNLLTVLENTKGCF